MKTKQSISSLLGLTQLDMAMLLNVSRSHYSLYELGKRSLPLHATKMLAEMLEHLQTPGESARRMQYLQLQAQHECVTRMLRENEYQQLLLTRKIEAVKKKQSCQMKLVMINDFLNIRANSALPQCRTISKKSLQGVGTDQVTELLQLELKLDVLELEKLLLEAKFLKFNKTLVNTENY